MRNIPPEMQKYVLDNRVMLLELGLNLLNKERLARLVQWIRDDKPLLMDGGIYRDGCG